MAATVVAVALLAGCTAHPGTTSAPTAAVGGPTMSSATPTSASPSSCTSGSPNVTCARIEVPLDRANPDAGTIDLAYYVHPHTDTSAPASEPIFALPGGPGESGLAVMSFVLTLDTVLEHHDIVAIDPRGTGRSGAIDCPDLQDGWNNARALQAGMVACGKQLGDAADRYGAGDVAMDLDAVRGALGHDRIDLYAMSYGNVPAQAYAARFPEHLHAVVFDAGMTVTDPAHVWGWLLGVPRALPLEVATMCVRAGCAGTLDPASTLRWLVRRVAVRPVLPGGGGRDPIGQAEVANLLRSTGTCTQCGQADPAQVVAAATALKAGDAGPLRHLAANFPLWPTAEGMGGPSDFSQGDNAAATCNDQDFVWARRDPIAVRQRKFDAAVAAMPKDVFAPFTIAGWNAYAWPDLCINWPAPDRFEPAVPPHTVFADIPALILAGDSDTSVPPVVVETLHREFPHATFVTVAGAGHPVIGPAWGHCAADLVGRFFETLNVGDTSCAKVPA